MTGRNPVPLELAIALTIVGVIVLVCWLAMPSYFRADDSDAPDGTPSGVSVRTDALTGCQYLAVYRGGITPRLDGAGRHVGCRR